MVSVPRPLLMLPYLTVLPRSPFALVLPKLKRSTQILVSSKWVSKIYHQNSLFPLNAMENFSLKKKLKCILVSFSVVMIMFTSSNTSIGCYSSWYTWQHFVHMTFSVSICQGHCKGDEATDYTDRPPEFKTQFCHLTALWLYTPVSYMQIDFTNMLQH